MVCAVNYTYLLSCNSVSKSLLVFNHADRSKNKGTIVTTSHFLFLTCTGEKCTELVHYYTIYTVTKCVPSDHKKPLLGMVALCARMQTPFHSSPMLEVNYPFLRWSAPTSPLTSLDSPFDPKTPPALVCENNVAVRNSSQESVINAHGSFIPWGVVFQSKRQ